MTDAKYSEFKRLCWGRDVLSFQELSILWPNNADNLDIIKNLISLSNYPDVRFLIDEINQEISIQDVIEVEGIDIETVDSSIRSVFNNFNKL